VQPEQIRAARAALNWSLERLAEASGVHRNTISNFETRKYVGEPEKIGAIKHALEEAGIIFTEEEDDTLGAGLRRFRIGDIVRFRPQTTVRFDFNIAADELGTVIGVEPHPPATGPTYKIEVQFDRCTVPYIFRFEYELVRIAPSTPESAQLKFQNEITMTVEQKNIIDEFCTVCTNLKTDYDLYRSLVETDRRTFDLCRSIAPLFFEDLNRILIENLFLQFSKITDPAKTGKNANLTTNYILEEIPWPNDLRDKLRPINNRLMNFRKLIELARSKRIAHADLHSQIQHQPTMGQFIDGAEVKFLEDLQMFINISYGYFNGGAHHSISPGGTTDTHQLFRALGKSVVFDRCLKCTPRDRNTAVLDYELLDK
jgi:transcriptional regulator with XRE-family HTH domain